MKTILKTLFFCGVFAAQGQNSCTEYEEKNGLVIIEAENTQSDYDLWIKKTDVPGYTGSGHLEFTGNNTSSGPPRSPLTYTFKINQGGTYQLLMRTRKRITGDDENDKSNDSYVRVEGDYTATGNPRDASLVDLKQDTKIFGGEKNSWGWSRKLDVQNKFKRNPIYNFKTGETYTFVMSGRAKQNNVDRIIFYKKSDYTESQAQQTISIEETTCSETDSGSQAQQVLNTPSKGVYGELKKWHRITIAFEGPNTSENATNNPFLNYRLNVNFKHTQTSEEYIVPGYYAADGNAANSSANSGKIWRVHFAPSRVGEWTYEAQFRSGNNIALKTSITAGNPATINNNTNGIVTGSFSVQASDKSGRDNRAKGRLQYVGERYLKWKETGEYFIKQGPDAPENFLAYQDFDGNFKSDGVQDNRIKTWQPHIRDWKTGDPTWKNGKGKGMIGAINYLVSEDLNVFSFLTMNIEGDDENVFPYIESNNRRRIDISRLDQWEVVFNHADQNGMFLHFKTQETENELLLDNGNLGTERKLYYRELIARFGHHLALNWNLGEENRDQSDQQRKDMAQYFHDNDPYRHLVVLHTYPRQKDLIYTPLLGDNSKLTGLSLQGGKETFTEIHTDVLEWLQKSKEAGKQWVVSYDEPGSGRHGLTNDDDNDDVGPGNYKDARQNVIWGTYLAGGTGNEWYFGGAFAESDLTLQDYRSRDSFWDYARYAKRFFKENNIPFDQMTNQNNLIGNTANENNQGYCFAKTGDTYIVYLPEGGNKNLNLRGVSGNFNIKWFDPRNGGVLKNGTVTNINGGGSRNIGNPPNNVGKDWTALITKTNGENQAPLVSFETPTDGASINEGDNIRVSALASDNDGEISSVTLFINDQKVREDREAPYKWGGNSLLRNLEAGEYILKLVAEDNDGAKTTEVITLNVMGSVQILTQTLLPVHDAYLQDSRGFNTNVIRVENNRRTAYLQYDLSGIQSEIKDVKLEFVVYSDSGNGNLTISKGTSNNWTENNISLLNKPEVDNLLGTFDGNYIIGEKITIPLSSSEFIGNKISLILQHNGNDFAFASKENLAEAGPKLIIEYENISRNFEDSNSKESSILNIISNPVKDGYLNIYQKENWYLRLYDITGKQIMELDPKNTVISVDVSNLPSGIYILKSDSTSQKLIIN